MQNNSIPMTVNPKIDCYAVLGVSRAADDLAIYDAFTALAETYHPERYSGTRDEAQRKLADLSAAYKVLSDPIQRRRYDLHRRIDAVTASIDAKKPAAKRLAIPAAEKELARRRRPPRGRLLIYALLFASLLLSVFGIVRYGDGAPQRTASPAGAPAGVPATRPAAALVAPAARDARPPLAPSPADGPGNTPPADPAFEACTDVHRALGLCPAK